MEWLTWNVRLWRPTRSPVHPIQPFIRCKREINAIRLTNMLAITMAASAAPLDAASSTFPYLLLKEIKEKKCKILPHICINCVNHVRLTDVGKAVLCWLSRHPDVSAKTLYNKTVNSPQNVKSLSVLSPCIGSWNWCFYHLSSMISPYYD